ncbi:uncharacterized protein LOC128425535 [Pleuronectes platessa]|uniref:uncharacterized protein LOC128425535 n=1 Tax=Pleuronectes platessa TaxID=8262 RepID=UPI00232A5398|nr:uncharacterized protein LOC128425535 [Pleuronectes platessa]
MMKLQTDTRTPENKPGKSPRIPDIDGDSFTHPHRRTGPHSAGLPGSDRPNTGKSSFVSGIRLQKEPPCLRIRPESSSGAAASLEQILGSVLPDRDVLKRFRCFRLRAAEVQTAPRPSPRLLRGAKPPGQSEEPTIQTSHRLQSDSGRDGAPLDREEDRGSARELRGGDSRCTSEAEPQDSKTQRRMNPQCARCAKIVYPTEKVSCLDKNWHKGCFHCEVCKMTLNMKNYKGYDKKPYCNAHYPKTSFTIVADTPENLRLRHQSELQSQVKYKKDFEESKGRGFSIVSDTPEMQRLRRTQEQISNVCVHTHTHTHTHKHIVLVLRCVRVSECDVKDLRVLYEKGCS